MDEDISRYKSQIERRTIRSKNCIKGQTSKTAAETLMFGMKNWKGVIYFHWFPLSQSSALQFL